MNPFAALGLGLVLGLRDAADAACMSHSGREQPFNGHHRYWTCDPLPAGPVL